MLQEFEVCVLVLLPAGGLCFSDAVLAIFVYDTRPGATYTNHAI